MIQKTFSKIEGHRIALAEVSQMDNDPDWVYFNRLNVPPPMRGKGVATQLLTELTKWADANGINIYLDINPYGGEGGMSLAQLVMLYHKFGFESVNKQTMTREARYERNIIDAG